MINITVDTRKEQPRDLQIPHFNVKQQPSCIVTKFSRNSAVDYYDVNIPSFIQHTAKHRI